MKRKETIPLLYDHHTHTSGRAAHYDCVDLTDVRDKDKAISLIKANCSEERVNVVTGLINSYYSFSSNELEKMPPVVICNLSFHGFSFNEEAERKVEEKFGSTQLLERLRDPDWTERNLPKVIKFLTDLEGVNKEKLDRVYDFYLEKGIWRTDDMLLPSEDVLDMFVDSGYDERTEFWADLETYEGLSKNAKKKVKGIKVFADGALGPKTAAIKESYSHEDDKGILIYNDDELKEIIEKLETLKKDRISIHTIGDRAIEQVIDVIAELEEKGFSLPKTRLEHVQFISEKYAEEAKRLGIILSMQPNFSLDSEYYVDRLSEKYVRKNNHFRMLIDEVGFIPGQDLIFGSDGMPYGATSALMSSLFPPFESQRLTLEEFKRGYCVEDKKRGYIELQMDERKKEIKIEEVIDQRKI